MQDTQATILTQISSDELYKDYVICYASEEAAIKDFIALELRDVEVITYKKRDTLNAVATFDIETTNILRENDRVATMYHWQMCIEHLVILGRTWDEWFDIIEFIGKEILLANGVWLNIYVHNLGFEFQFIQHFFEWTKVFARSKRSPIYADTTLNIQFRCSYMLCNKPLEKLTKAYKFPIAKGTDFDYDKIRHCKTPLTENEIRYCINDVVALGCFIANERKRNGNIAHIPLTQTGYIRRELKERCFYRENSKAKEYRHMIHELVVTPQEYFTLRRAFAGGFTHANVLNVNEIHKNVKSYDIASSYPTIICSEKFPMSSGEYHESLSLDEYNTLLEEHCIIADFIFTDLRPKDNANEHYIAVHKCRNSAGGYLSKTMYEDDNNKIMTATELCTTITNVDFTIINQFYDYDTVTIQNVYVYDAGFLPKEVIQLTADLYNAKTKLKNIKGQEDDYLQSKEMLNSIYGMCVTDIIQPEIIYNNGVWDTKQVNKSRAIEKYNRATNRTLFYPWGVFITAYARRNVLWAIWACGDNYIYSDTDSVKILNAKQHEKYFNAYNECVSQKIKYIFTTRGIDIDLAFPRDTDGVIHPLGHFECDDVYLRFKTLGAKRYLGEHIVDGKVELLLTIAGVHKTRGAEYLSQFRNPFKKFAYNLCFPAAYSGKLVATYTDDPIEGMLDDGQTIEPYEELSCCHLMASDYNLDVADEFLNLQKLVLDISGKK